MSDQNTGTKGNINKTKQIAMIAIFSALYFVLSAVLKIPVGGHMTLDLGYISLMVATVCLGAVPAMLVGIIGAFLESALMSMRGVSPGWMLMNAIIGYFCGLILMKASEGERRPFLIKAFIAVPISALVGMAVKTLVDCVLYSLPLAAKIPVAIIGWIADTAVMLALGLPLSIILKKQIKTFIK